MISFFNFFLGVIYIEKCQEKELKLKKLLKHHKKEENVLVKLKVNELEKLLEKIKEITKKLKNEQISYILIV